MVHALREAHRVLKPNGLLLDLRPAKVHRRVGILTAGRWQVVGRLRETFDDDTAADRAVSEVVKAGLFHPGRRRLFDVDRVMDTVDEFRAWLEDTVEEDQLASHRRLVERLGRAQADAPVRAAIVARGPLALRVMTKLG